jgi:hypothetical protein
LTPTVRKIDTLEGNILVFEIVLLIKWIIKFILKLSKDDISLKLNK